MGWAADSDEPLGQGKSIEEIARHVGITEST